ncbi:RagB/SusD family nutrient uptake outer membrane protein [uncultured Alistipes sp.]|uniref:RagB/SusD family nutrient uptake outer membrane protein n=1 Tax=uncultured Alistipes sp. TaxID=538949 RepID=UPI002638EBD9|nr:RagB/SusD family nutrient uptake outer membrane protein [uncultured Alistipes sp.]
MKKYIVKLASIASVFTLAGCNDWLDMDPTDKVSDKIVWSDENYIQQYANGFYGYLSRYSSFETQDSQVGLTDGLTETLKFGSDVEGTNVGFANIIAYARGGLSAPTAAFHFGCWDNLYDRIRRVNEFLYNLKKYGTWLDEETYARYAAEVRFFRGYLYWQLLKRTPQAIIYDEDLLAIRPDMPLSTEEEGWDMVERDLTFAARTLPAQWSAAEQGRVTSGAAWAMLSRAMLYAKRWDAARTAAEEVFKLDYELMPGQTAADYAKAFTSAREGNTESILEYNYLASGPNHGWDQLFMPGGDNVTMGGRATPTQEMVESYELATTGGHPDWTPWHTAEGTTQTPPWADLEPRFHASVLYNGAAWKNRTVEPYVKGKDGWAEYGDGTPLAGRTTTGYYLRKMLNENYTDYSRKCTQPWIAIRLAEVYLNHAEACHMLGETKAANDDVRAIRARVGLPYTDKAGDELMAAIRQERKIELYCEGHHYWDMRRWRLAHTAFTGMRVHGLKITFNQTTGTFTYAYVECDTQDRLFEEKLYRIPLPETELSNNTAVSQFPEWL